MLTLPVQLVKRDPKGDECGMLAAPGEAPFIANTVSLSARLRRHFETITDFPVQFPDETQISLFEGAENSLVTLCYPSDILHPLAAPNRRNRKNSLYFPS
jgi:hypothetical protein